MKKPVQKDKTRPADNAQADRPEAKADEVLIDPATGLQVVRDLRYREFVAHQRGFYFLNHRDSQ